MVPSRRPPNGSFRVLRAGELIFWLVVFPLTARADTINWTNTLGGNWNIAQNWSPNVMPTSNAIAVITNDGSYTVNINVSPTLSSLVLGGGSGTQTWRRLLAF
jgi:hypothetical protein